MIEIFTGTPGSGKSLHLADIIRTALSKENRPVIGNFLYKAEAVKPKKKSCYIYINNDKMDVEFLIWFSEYYTKEVYKKRVPEEHILLVIDESQLLFNAREWNKKGRGDWISFFTQHRKLGYHIIMVAQDRLMLDKQVRAVLEYEVMHRKISNIGKFGKFLSILSGGSLHVAVKIYVPLEHHVGSSWFLGDRSLYQLYDSYTRF